MESWSWFGANIPKRARESKLLALLLPNLRPVVPVLADLAAASGRENDGQENEVRENEVKVNEGRENGGEENGDLGWTAGLSRGADLPLLRLSIRSGCCRPNSRLPESAMRFETFCAPQVTGTKPEIQGER